ncbi:lysylphosphatidylglycerol synthase domain-containing protein [Aliihoeflea sp. PC F10.4]
MKNKIWAVVGLCAVAFSIWLLAEELRGTSFDEFWDSFVAISTRDWCLAVVATLGAYAALAGYDHLALMHLKRRVGWLFISLCSFTTYALAHNIGASVFSGALVRYRAYSSKGLTASEIGFLVAFCSFTFALGTLLLTAIVLLIKPDITERFSDVLPVKASTMTALAILALIAIYVIGSWLKLRPLKVGSFELTYPRLPIVSRQLVIAPLELACAAAIVYFALPEAGNPGYFIILGIFLVSFSVALISHAPGGIGVLELVFITGLPDMDPVDVLAALFVFRLLYLIIPLIVSLFVVLGFERAQLAGKAETS